MKNFTLIFAVIALFAFNANAQNQTIYKFKAKTISGDQFDFSTLKGKKVLIVNTASKCGLTPQYKSLQKIFEAYGGEKFTIIGFPANNFGKQEPGTNAEIKEFCTRNYGVTFQMMEKIDVKGENMHPIYQWLTSKSKNGVVDAPVTWNFQKFMIDEKGRLVDFAPPKEKPESERIVNWIRNTL